MKFIQKNGQGFSFIGLMAAKDSSRFYEKFGFIKRAENSPGMSLIIEK